MNFTLILLLSAQSAHIKEPLWKGHLIAGVLLSLQNYRRDRRLTTRLEGSLPKKRLPPFPKVTIWKASVNTEGHPRGSISRLQHEFLQIFQEDSYYLEPKFSIYYTPYGLFFPQNGEQKSVMLNSEEVKHNEMMGPYRKCNKPLYCLTESPTLQLFIPILILTNCPPPHPFGIANLIHLSLTRLTLQVHIIHAKTDK